VREKEREGERDENRRVDEGEKNKKTKRVSSSQRSHAFRSVMAGLRRISLSFAHSSSSVRSTFFIASLLHCCPPSLPPSRPHQRRSGRSSRQSSTVLSSGGKEKRGTEIRRVKPRRGRSARCTKCAFSFALGSPESRRPVSRCWSRRHRRSSPAPFCASGALLLLPLLLLHLLLRPPPSPQPPAPSSLSLVPPARPSRAGAGPRLLSLFLPDVNKSGCVRARPCERETKEERPGTPRVAEGLRDAEMLFRARFILRLALVRAH
jgi:hypothetical protein